MANDGRGRGAKNRQAKREQQAAWNLALAEGRVVQVRTVRMTCFGLSDEITTTAYQTALRAQEALDEAREAGLNASILRVS